MGVCCTYREGTGSVQPTLIDVPCQVPNLELNPLRRMQAISKHRQASVPILKININPLYLNRRSRPNSTSRTLDTSRHN